MDINTIPISSSTVIAGIGNPDRGDDQIGIYVAQKLVEAGLDRVFICGTSPENYLTKICGLSPDLVIFVDAVDTGDEAGSIDFLNPEDVSQGISTHDAGLDMVSEFIYNSCGAMVVIAGVQPARLSGEWMTEKVKDAGDRLARLLGEKLCMKQ